MLTFMAGMFSCLLTEGIELLLSMVMTSMNIIDIVNMFNRNFVDLNNNFIIVTDR